MYEVCTRACGKIIVTDKNIVGFEAAKNVARAKVRHTLTVAMLQFPDSEEWHPTVEYTEFFVRRTK